VSLDPDDEPLPDIRKKLAEFGGVGTLALDPQGVSAQALGLESFPATDIITGAGPGGGPHVKAFGFGAPAPALGARGGRSLGHGCCSSAA
jgi:hypothetical protein